MAVVCCEWPAQSIFRIVDIGPASIAEQVLRIADVRVHMALRIQLLACVRSFFDRGDSM